MIKRTMTTLLPVLAALFAAPAVAQDSPPVTEDAASRYARAMADTESLQRYNLLLEEQVRSQEAEVASIGRQMVEIETTSRQVQPLMQEMVNTLDQFIKLDVPRLFTYPSSVTCPRSTTILTPGLGSRRYRYKPGEFTKLRSSRRRIVLRTTAVPVRRPVR